ncbi:glycosyltransferase family 39 protein [Opitutus sp. ER46]|uniref:glycosyltransferase family 39 protein n=1 Tax=Opitutus sp. ER46 TaxID=2161864 RepID=UPI000D2FA285|nr:glycosyltransferase family 39 protein [Opitutus sp. ER46]PTX97735.1 hypothetical protein DB354_05490 [Opitutus sp. ER46]
MDSDLPATSPTSPPARARRQRIRRWLIAAALAVFGLLLAQHIGAVAGGADSSGYLNHSRALAEGHVRVEPRTVEGFRPQNGAWAYVPLGFKVAADHQMLVPTYPTGLPLWILAAAQVVGWNRAGDVVLWLHAMAGVLLTYGMARAFGLERRGAAIAAVIVAGGPLYLFMAVQAMSDVPALVWTTATLLAAWRSRARTPWAFGAGAAFAMAVLMRPTNALALLPVALTLGLSWRRWAAFIVGGIPGGVFFLLHTHAAYGSYFTTGYGSDAGLDRTVIVPTLWHYARMLPVVFTPFVVGFLALPLLARRMPRQTAVLLAWALVFAGFYAAYPCTHETWWYLRFILPAAPAFIIGALLVGQTFLAARCSCRARTVLACLILAAAFGWNTYWNEKWVTLHAASGEKVYALTTDWLRQNLPANAVIAAMQNTGAIYYYTDFTFVRWDQLDAKSFAQLASALAAQKRPLYAVLHPFELEEHQVFSSHLPTGRWQQIGQVRDVTIWQWSPPAPAGS